MQWGPPALAEQVKAGKLPPIDKRLPQKPLVVPLGDAGTSLGRHGGTLNTLAGRSRDTRLFTIYGYARLVGYDRSLHIVPDILESLEVQQGRVFTFHLRHGHRWSDGHPFTSEDFRYYWEDVANNKELSPSGPPRDLLVDGEAVGAINRVPEKGQIRSNMAVGGKPEPVELSARDREICAAIGPELKRRGLLFVGIDVIGDYLTEINVTSPTGAVALKRFTGIDAAEILWDRIEAISAGR